MPAVVDVLFPIPLPGANLQRVVHCDGWANAVLIIPP